MKKIIRQLIWKILGSNDTSKDVAILKEQVRVLQYFLNSLNDIRNIPPTNDKDLRLLQLCDAQLLAIIDKVCRKHGLSYWLDFGTLLGAVRHKGFIPWDDDTDISMPYSDYVKVADIINEELSQFDITAEYEEGRIGIGYRHKETGVWADILPVCDFYTNRNRDDIYSELKEKIYCFLTIAERDNTCSQNEIISKIRELASGLECPLETGRHYLCYYPRYSNCDFTMNLYDEIFPLKEMEFEGQFYFVPKGVDNYLRRIFGDYMQFPKCNVLHHGIGRLPLSLWAKENSIDMNEIYNKLLAINHEYGK